MCQHPVGKHGICGMNACREYGGKWVCQKHYDEAQKKAVA